MFVKLFGQLLARVDLISLVDVRTLPLLPLAVQKLSLLLLQPEARYEWYGTVCLLITSFSTSFTFPRGPGSTADLHTAPFKVLRFISGSSRMFTGSFSSSGPDSHLSLFFSLFFFPILLFLGKLYKLMWQNEHTHTHRTHSSSLSLSYRRLTRSHRLLLLSTAPPRVSIHSTSPSRFLLSSEPPLFYFSQSPQFLWMQFLHSCPIFTAEDISLTSPVSPRAPSFCILSVSSSSSYNLWLLHFLIARHLLSSLCSSTSNLNQNTCRQCFPSLRKLSWAGAIAAFWETKNTTKSSKSINYLSCDKLPAATFRTFLHARAGPAAARDGKFISSQSDFNTVKSRSREYNLCLLSNTNSHMISFDCCARLSLSSWSWNL